MPSIFKSIIALIISASGVHLLYTGVIRPQAERALAIAQAEGQSTIRTLAVILKDYEQEICIILMFWGLFLIIDKCISIARHRYLFDIDLMESSPDDEESVEPRTIMEEMEVSLESLQSLPQNVQSTPLVETLTASVRRFVITKSVQNTSDAIVTGVDALAARIESENAMIRYLIWAIPSIGFLGTVRGIGQALAQADEALSGDIANMAASLGVAFNSTFVALIISIFLMFFLHQLQRLQDGLVVDTQAYCEKFLLNRIGKTDEES